MSSTEQPHAWQDGLRESVETTGLEAALELAEDDEIDEAVTPTMRAAVVSAAPCIAQTNCRLGEAWGEKPVESMSRCNERTAPPNSARFSPTVVVNSPSHSSGDDLPPLPWQQALQQPAEPPGGYTPAAATTDDPQQQFTKAEPATPPPANALPPHVTQLFAPLARPLATAAPQPEYGTCRGGGRARGQHKGVLDFNLVRKVL